MDKKKLLCSSELAQAILLPALALLCILLILGALVAYGSAMNTVVLKREKGKGMTISFGKPDKIAVIYVEGQMVADRSPDSAGSSFSSDVVKYMRAATDDPDVKAIVLRVNSPGGTPVASEEIISQMKKTRAIKPIIVSMGDIATSAAYYISSQSDRIVANADTFTGSIGVIWVFKNKTKYYNDEGVNFYVAKSGNFKDLGSDWRGLSAGEKDYVQGVINESYDRFVKNVAKGRNMSEESVREIADGRVYTGSKAKEMGLVDDLGGLYDAVDIAKKMARIKGKVTVVHMNEPSVK